MNVTFLHSVFYVFLICIGMLTTSELYAQRSCGSVHPMSTNAVQDPSQIQNYKAIEKRIKEQINQKSASVVIVIPVVFHIIHDGDLVGNGENISNALIEAQLMQLNDDFRRMNTDQNNIWNQASDTEIEFCLATIDTLGNATTGILRHNIQGGPWTRPNFNGQVKPLTIWNRDEYLNIWSADLSGDLLGYAQFPDGGAANTDGVVCLYSSFGSLSIPQSGGSPFNLGRTLTHEVGHWLGLYHIWGDVNGCGGTDEVADTPNQEEDSSGCPDGVNLDQCSSSTPGYMYQNYMDYTNDACMNLFTSGQKTRMRAAITAYRSGLNSSKCSASQPITADFIPENGMFEFCPSGQLQLEDMSTGPITTISWTFSGAGVSPTSSSDPNPILQFTETGTLSASLTASNATDSDTKQATISITVLDENSSTCQSQPCLDFDVNDGGPYSDLFNADGPFLNCALVEAGFEVFSSEAYALAGLKAGTSYTFEFCNGYDSNVWDAIITIGKYDKANDKAFPNSNISHVNGCSITFTPSDDDDYIAVVTTVEDCNTPLDDRENGALTFRCNEAPSDICGMQFVDNGGINDFYSLDQNKVYTLCPSNTNCEKLALVFSEFDLGDSPNCTDDYMIIHDGIGVHQDIIGRYCGSNNPGTVVSTSNSGCLTIEFVSDGVNPLSKGWAALIDCLDDGSCGNECPDGYALSGIESGSGGPLNNGEYHSNGAIISSQSINNSDVVYNALNSVCLEKDFNISPNATFSVYLDGCNSGAKVKE